MTLEVLDLRPVGKGRPRFAGNHAFTPERTREYESLIRTQWILKHGARAAAGPVRVACVFEFTPPASWTKKRKQDALAGLEMVKKPDCDNLIKAVLDALNGFAYLDDSQVQQISAVKRYASRSAVKIWVLPIDAF